MKKYFILAMAITTVALLRAEDTPEINITVPALPPAQAPAPAPAEPPTAAPAPEAPAPVTPAPQPETPAVPTPPAAPATETAPAAAPAPTQTSETPAPKPASPPKAPKVIPQSYGDRTGQVFIGHRAVIDRYSGWGWIWKEDETPRKGDWVLLEEEPGVIVAPARYGGRPDADNDTRYKLYGEIMPYKGYEPNYDVFVSVFKIKGFEIIGKGERPNLQPPRHSSSRSGSAFSRRNQDLMN